ncbi:hypothetical protein [Dyadobacter chenhuakuii]|uniref:Uncharacterized protein n=1 Tax=Dyadobacter chenhuakuii TaxID=2909339 RepID=A0A9X1QF73_9BACT|nr:hypothetical protein [Dyadobacter chenhuakuii]MCF2499248.1 hypothetical protein [Dyadobacter chenhuakuii]
MKTSENKLNEALRSALKRKFDNFENTPDPSAFEKIRANIKPIPQWKYLFFSLLFVGIAVTGIITDQHFLNNRAKKLTSVHAADVKNSSLGSPAAEASAAESSAPGSPAAGSPATESSAAGSPAAGSSVKESDFLERGISKKSVVASRVIHLSKATFKNSDHVDQNSLAGSKGELKNESLKSQLHEMPSLDESDSNDAESDIIVNSEKARPGAEPAVGEAIDITADMLDNQSYNFTADYSSLPHIDIPKSDVKPVVRYQRGHFNWLVNAAVLQSYQILTVPAGGQSFQNFEFPSTFSLRSLGYKVSVGAEKKGFQFMLHYSRFQQSYSYEIAGNDYVVHTVDQGKFVVIRQGTRVSQENQFSLLGIGVNKQVQWGNASVGKYYASAGLEYSYGMIRKQSIGWVNAGIGKQFPINRKTSLHIGPYAEFSPVKFTGSGDPFYYQPYRVGVSAGLMFGR